MMKWEWEQMSKTLNSKSFSAKILLFGEYSIIRKSNALAIPYSLFDGKLIFPKERSRNVDPELQAFSRYIKKLIEKDELGFNFDERTFSFDIAGGLIFDSSIPQGYGVGSSGALCAAVFDQYAKLTSDEKQNIEFLKSYFSRLESHFHGSSSGVDPLISYLNRPVLHEGGHSLETVSIPEYKEGKGAIFLINTGRARRTEPLVNLFLEKCTLKEFAYLCDRVLAPITNKCIDHFLAGDTDSLFKEMRELSMFQFEHFLPMIPNLYQDLWKQGLDTSSYYLKLCGAGGGGFILGITKDIDKLSADFSNTELRPLFYF